MSHHRGTAAIALRTFLFATTKGYTVGNLIIECSLLGEAVKRVPGAHQIETMKLAVDDGNVDAYESGPNTHFLNDTRVVVACMLSIKHRPDSFSDVSIAHEPNIPARF
jgi:hypothetical protein